MVVKIVDKCFSFFFLLNVYQRLSTFYFTTVFCFSVSFLFVNILLIALQTAICL